MTPLETSVESLANEIRILFEEKLKQNGLWPKSGRLPRPRICVMEAHRSKAIRGWYAQSRWQQGAAKLDELVLTPEAVSHGVYTAIEVLAHEFVHLVNAALGRADTSRNGRYHNALFREMANLLGLNVSRDEQHGWRMTKLGPDLKRWGRELIRAKKVSSHVFKYQRGTSTKGRSLVKLVGKCGTFAYVTLSRMDDFVICCGTCGAILEPVSKWAK